MHAGCIVIINFVNSEINKIHEVSLSVSKIVSETDRLTV